MAYGLPIICGKTTCLKEVAGDAALIVDATNPFEIRDAMETLTKDHKILYQLSEHAKSRLKSFSFDQEMEKLASAIIKLEKNNCQESKVKGLSKDGTVEKEIVFSHQLRGVVNIHAHFVNESLDTRVWFRCGNRRFGSWELAALKETTIDTQVYCDGAPCVIEFGLDDNKNESYSITCKSIKISSEMINQITLYSK
jgi:hypothetical protein